MIIANSTLWLESSHNAAFGCGGWAYVTAAGGTRAGLVGGERTPSPERIALAGVVEAMKVAPGADLTIHSCNRQILLIPSRIADAAKPPVDSLELWAPIATAINSGKLRFAPADVASAPVAFVTAWAELARDKAKVQGAFRAAIPKPNLAKAGV